MGFSVVAMSLVIVALSGCSDKSTKPNTKAPDLPPQSSFIVDFSNFTAPSGVAAFTGDPSDTFSHVNWTESALKVGFWNLVLTINLAVPTASFVEAFNHTPVELSDGSWQWSYNVTVAGDHYACKLIGSIESAEVHWRMYLSKEGEFTDYLWYSGTHDLLATSGTWTVNRGPGLTNPYIGIVWQRDIGAGIKMIKYTNIIPGDAANGSYVEYQTNVVAGIDRRYTIFNSEQVKTTTIEWDHLNHNGRVMDPAY